MPSQNAILVFAKLPQPGRVKTRLLGLLAPRQAAELHSVCLQDTLALVESIPGCDKWLLVAAPLEAAQQLASALKLGSNWKVAAQCGPNLGARLANALTARFRAGAKKVVVVGTDTPWMGRRRIQHALAWLDAADVVLGPTADGGYYLLAARRLVPEIFRGIPWGTSQVLARTRHALEQTRTPYRLLPRNFDLDHPADLFRISQLLQEGKLRAQALCEWIAAWEVINESSRRR